MSTVESKQQQVKAKLRADHGYTAREISHQTGIAANTVRRHLKDLQAAGQARVAGVSDDSAMVWVLNVKPLQPAASGDAHR